MNHRFESAIKEMPHEAAEATTYTYIYYMKYTYTRPQTHYNGSDWRKAGAFVISELESTPPRHWLLRRDPRRVENEGGGFCKTHLEPNLKKSRETNIGIMTDRRMRREKMEEGRS